MMRSVPRLIQSLLTSLLAALPCSGESGAAGSHDGVGGLVSAVSNAVAPELSVSGLDLSRVPTSEELAAAGQLGGRLFPTRPADGRPGEESARRAFGEAIERWNRHEYPAAVGLFHQFVRDFPDSAWAAEANLHIGCDALYNGRQTEAEAIFSQVLGDCEGSQDAGARMLTGKALQRLGMLDIERNNLDVATVRFGLLLQKGADWRQRTYASHWLQRLSRLTAAKEGLMKCGSEALAYALAREGQPEAAARVRAQARASMRGQSVLDLVELGAVAGQELVAVDISAADLFRLPLPAILHIGAGAPGRRGHYWVLDKVAKNHLELFDPQSGRRLSQTPEELSKEWSGTALIFPKGNPIPGRKLPPQRMEQTFGGCCGVPRAEDGLGNPGNQSASESDSCSEGSPRWVVNVVTMNFFLTDTPLWYDPSIGPPVRITLSYNSQSAITQYEPFGSKWQFNYASYLVVDTAHTVLVFMPDGRQDSYTPDGDGGYLRPFQVFNTLVQIGPNHFELRFPDGTVYVYRIPAGTTSQQPFLTQIRDAHNQKLTLGYDAQARLVTITDARNLVTELTYNPSGLVTNVADPFGRNASFQYDADGNLVRSVDMGGYWTGYSYDDNVYLTGITDERGSWSLATEPADGINNGSNPYPPPGTTMFQNYRITVTDPAGFSREYYYDGYSSLSWHIGARDYMPWRTAYDNNLANNVPRTIYYFVQMNAGRQGEVSTVVRPEGDFLDFGYDADTGNLTSVIDGHNNSWTYTYNSMGCVTSKTNPRGLLTSFSYANNGVDLVLVSNQLGAIQITWDAYHGVTSITDRLGHRGAFSYNAAGQLITEVDPLQVTNLYIYDATGRLAQIQRAGLRLEGFTYDPPGRVLTHTDASGLTVTNQYSPLNQLISVSYPDGRSERYVYSACCPDLLDSATDRGGRTISFVYDSLKRLVQRIDPAKGLTAFNYDAAGNLIGVVDPNGNTTCFSYDLDNRLASRTRPDGGVVTFSYDEGGLLTSRVNARGIATTYTYDEDRELAEIDYSDGTPSVISTYDTCRRLVQVTDAVGTNTFAYDADSRLASRGGAWPNDTITFGYDALDRATNVTVQLGQSVGYVYDSLNRLTQVHTAAGNYVYSYLGASPLPQQLSRPNGSYSLSQYDAVNRLTRLSNRKSTGEVISEFAYTYTSQDFLGSESVSNALGTSPSTGQRLTCAYNKANQLTLCQPGNQAFTYDADGNLIAGYTPDGFAFAATYDAESRLATLQYTNSSGQVCLNQYSYHADGGLAEIVELTNGVAARDTKLVADGFFPLQDRDALNNDSVLREYAWGLDMGGGIGGLLELKAASSRNSYVYDGKGNVTSLLGGDQGLQAAYAYEPFGEIVRTAGALVQPMRFSTKRYDDQTGLAYFGFRFYSPVLGMWMSRDPLPRDDDSGLYRFAEDNPIQGIDAFGLDCTKWSDPFKKNDDYANALKPSKQGTQGASDQQSALKKLWNAAANALGGDDSASSSSSSSPPSNRGRKLGNYPNK